MAGTAATTAIASNAANNITFFNVPPPYFVRPIGGLFKVTNNY
jgi:hypothetical protein